MDIHMPVMDGLEASNKIHELDNKIPVVAMTANVMADDKDNYLKNGMNSCIGKPFTSQELWYCLMKYFTPLNAADTVNSQEEAAGSKDSEMEFLKSLKSLFVRDNQNKFNEIINALENDDIELAHRLTHTLKSNAGQIGKTVLQKAAADVESRLKNGKNLVTDDLLSNLNSEMLTVLDEFYPLLLETDIRIDTAQKEIDKDKALELLKRLESLLQSGNPECLNYISDVCTVPGNNDLKLQLIQQMDDFKFDQALSSCYDLMEKLNE
jgi:CheY-like chemotaxis protein